MCPSCYEEIKSARSVDTLPEGDRLSLDVKHWWEIPERGQKYKKRTHKRKKKEVPL